MFTISLQGQASTGDEAFDVGISDLLVTMGPNGPVLVSVSRVEGGLVSYSLADGAAPALAATQGVNSGLHTANGPSLLALGESVLATGLETGSLHSWGLSSTNTLIGSTIAGAGSGAWTHLTAISETRIALAAENGTTLSVFDLTAAGDWVFVQDHSDTSDSFLQDLGALQAATVDGTDFLITASTSETGVSVYEVTGTNILVRGHVDATDGVGLMIPTDLETIRIGAQTYVLVASAPTTFGAGAITVMELASDGSLTPTDHIMDTLHSRFAQIQTLSAVEHGDIAFVAAGGGDDGISLLALVPGGRIIHLTSLANSIDGGLDDVTEIETLIIGDRLHIYVATGSDHGIATLTVDLSQLGVTLSAQKYGDTLSGGNDNDILVDNAGTDTLSGGNGRDLFVMTADGKIDTITDFNVAYDTLDLSAWMLLYDVNALTLTSTDTGARIEWRGEVLIVNSQNRTPIDVDALKDAITLDINRSFFAPQSVLAGTGNRDTLSGTWGNDTLSGMAGHDTLFGGGGDDTLYGGSGNDVLFAGSGDDRLYSGSGNNSIYGGSGGDTLVFAHASTDIITATRDGDTITLSTATQTNTMTGIETYDFTDGALSFHDLSSLFWVTTLTGTNGDDILTAGTRPTLLLGYDGDDILTGGSDDDTLMGHDGNDILDGFQGHDLIYAGSGNDDVRAHSGNDTLYGEDGDDTLRGGPDEDLIFGGDGDDALRGQRHNDTLYGGDGNDNLKGGGGDDTLVGGDGDDWLHGGTGGDVFYFAPNHGADIVADFDLTEDTLSFSTNLLAGITSANDLLDTYATLTANGAFFDFGAGNMILLERITTLDGLADALDLG